MLEQAVQEPILKPGLPLLGLLLEEPLELPPGLGRTRELPKQANLRLQEERSRQP